MFLSDASYFVLDESWKPQSLIEFSAISCDSMGGREQPVKASSGGVLDEWGGNTRQNQVVKILF